MVHFLPVGFGILLAGILAFVANPRLPTFSFKVLKLYPTLLHDSTPAFSISADIRLHNANFITAEVYAFTFDVYYPDWEERLKNIGQVTDVFQKQSDPTTTSGSATKEATNGKKKDAIWTLAPRSNFEKVDDVMMVPTNAGMKVFSNLSWDAFQKSGLLQVPLSGVFHIKANGKIPLSMSMICNNNVLDAWNMEFQGVSCHLDYVGPGWTDLTIESARLRSKLEDTTWRAADFPLPEAEESAVETIS
ncbi:unnamed protein product [Pseudo-nitzschia multistriata]|uniref:Uncharacterized protein n=1 Tax=Pseudo-nitzschia multistriata TaxID=183589 RepID=A0A448Z656_9STRA|nr:unnamed protein product [Pseudo-nitzschia multistriata]